MFVCLFQRFLKSTNCQIEQPLFRKALAETEQRLYSTIRVGLGLLILLNCQVPLPSGLERLCEFKPDLEIVRVTLRPLPGCRKAITIALLLQRLHPTPIILTRRIQLLDLMVEPPSGGFNNGQINRGIVSCG